MQVIGLDIETSGALKTATLEVVALDYGTHQEVYERIDYPDSFFINLFTKLSDNLIIAHNAKFDVSVIYRDFGVLLPNVFCTYMASRILTNGLGTPNSLVNCLKMYLGVVLEEHTDKARLQMSFKRRKITEEQRDYVLADIKYLIPLYNELSKRIKIEDVGLVMKLEMKLLPVIIKMETRGVRIDVPKLKRYVTMWGWMRDILLRKLDKEVNKLYDNHPNVIRPLFSTTNYNSTDQLVKLFTSFSVTPPTKKDEDGTKVSLDYDTIQTFINDNPLNKMVPFLNALVRYREFGKLISTYGDSFIAKVDANGYLHGEYNQLGADTGRLSSSNPNLQNIPATGFGGRIRKCFLAEDREDMITCDMDGAEIRIAADFSKDKLLVDSLVNGTDMHSQLASVSYSIIFGEPVVISKSEKPITIQGHTFIPKSLRDEHKSATFCKFYKGGPTRIKGVLGKYINLFHKKNAMGIAKAVSEALDKEMEGLSKFLDNIIKKANKTKKLTGAKFNRPRYFAGDVYGEAANFPIQNCNAEAIKMAMVKIDRYLTDNGVGRLVMSIHDEVVCSVGPGKAKEAALEIQKIMSESLGYFLTDIKGGASYKISKHWQK